MKRYIKNADYDSDINDVVEATEAVEVDINTHDFSQDSDDTYYIFDIIEEFRQWLELD